MQATTREKIGNLEFSVVNWKIKESFLFPAIQKEEKSRAVWALFK